MITQFVPSIVKRIIKGIPYYYLEHTLRDNNKFTHKSMYLGRTVPKDIGKIKKQFIFEIDQQKWFKTFEKIRENYAAEVNRSPKSAREKELLAFSVRFTYDTQRIEGSTLTLRETAQLLEEGISPSGKPIADVKEAETHRKVFFEMLGSRKDLTLSRVLDWHWSLFKETKPDIAGKIRRHGVKISGSKFVPPSPVELQALLTDFFEWYNLSKRKINPVELAALVHLKFVTIHPFTDGNGRISRLMMNFVLQKHGYPMLNIDHKKRRAYYRALERSQLSEDDRIFATWFFRRYEREFRSYE
jgi:Fic family protein